MSTHHTVLLIRQPDHHVTVAGKRPQIVPVAGTDAFDMIPNTEDGIDPLYRRDWLCPRMGDFFGVPRRAFEGIRVRATIEVIEQISLDKQRPKCQTPTPAT